MTTINHHTRGRYAALGLLALACVGLTACGGSDDKAEEPESKSVLEPAYSTCTEELGSTDTGGESISAEDLMSLGDDGDSITIENGTSASGDFAGILTGAAISCLLRETDAPDSLGSEVEQTTAMMGRESESWDDLTFEWSYHPDDGYSGVLKRTQ